MNYVGVVEPMFLSVADRFVRQIPNNGRSGGALCVYFRGVPVIDIWAGCKDHGGAPWQKDTLVNCFSTTKGVASTLIHVLAENGMLDYDAPVSAYWPEFHVMGKGAITLRQVLCHQSGLHRIRPLIDDALDMTDWSLMCDRLAQSGPAWHPGKRSAYHALTFGWLVGEVVQRVTGQTFSAALSQWLTQPLGLDGMYIGLPEAVFSRRALLAGFPPECRPVEVDQVRPRKRKRRRWQSAMQSLLIKQGFRLAGADWRESKAALAPRGIRRFSFNDPRVVASSIPAANGMFTATDLARLYAMIAEGGELAGVRLLSPQRVKAMGRIQVDGADKVLPVNMKWRLGYHRVFSTGARLPSAFGHFGWGGSGAWCDPVNRLAVGFVVNNHRSTSPAGDLRIMSLNRAITERAAEYRRAMGR